MVGAERTERARKVGEREEQREEAAAAAGEGAKSAGTLYLEKCHR